MSLNFKFSQMSSILHGEKELEEQEEQIMPSSFLILSRKYHRLEMIDAELEFI